MTTITYGTTTDLVAYLTDYVNNFERGSWGYFGQGVFDTSGPTYGFSESSAALIGSVGTSAWSVVATGDLDYGLWDGTHDLRGDLDSLSFGNGLSYASGTDTISQSTTALSITGLGLTGTDETDPVHQVIYGLMGGSDTTENPVTVTPLLNELNADDLTVIGTASADALYSMEGDDVLTGGGGADTFYFDLDAFSTLGVTLTGIGDDTITDFDTTADLISIDLGDTAYDSYAELDIADDASGNAVIDLGSYGTITLAGVSTEDLSASNFDFSGLLAA